MKSPFALTLLALSLSPAFAELAPFPAPACADEAVAEAQTLKGLLSAPAPFCAGTCERDFDCMPGCSCHMSGRCM